MKKILVVDDSKIWREYLKKFFTNKRFIVEEASNGLEGLNKFFEFLPDIVVTDYVMPKMNGIHLCRFIRGYPAFKNVGIAILTGVDETINDFWAKKSGANIFIRKNIGIEEVLKQLEDFVNNKNYTISWSKDFFKIIKEPFGELVDILEENLKKEALEKEVLQLVKYLSDEEYLIYKLYNFLGQIENFDGMYTLLLSASSGRVFGFNRNGKKFSADYLKSFLNSFLKRPITPSEWVFKGNVFSNDSNERFTKNYMVFPILWDDEEEGIFLFDNPANRESISYLLNLMLDSISIIIDSLNEFNNYKTQAEMDFLAGLYNKKFILSKLEEYINLSKRKGLALSLAVLDIDDFKVVNDKFGHVVGDKVLKKIAEVMKQSVRSTDIVGRYGGEEFIIIFPATDLSGAEIVIKRLFENIRNINWKETIGLEIRVTLSAGLTIYEYGMTPTELIEKADELLYKAKNSGKNKYMKKGDKQ